MSNATPATETYIVRFTYREKVRGRWVKQEGVNAVPASDAAHALGVVEARWANRDGFKDWAVVSSKSERDLEAEAELRRREQAHRASDAYAAEQGAAALARIREARAAKGAP